jgi:hypothetical protein
VGLGVEAKLETSAGSVLALAALVLVACSSTGDATDAQVDGPGSDVPIPGSQASVACVTDSDCTAVAHTMPVASPGDCYCPTCPGTPFNVTTAQAYVDGWQAFCADDPNWAACPVLPCAPPPPVACAAGTCRLASKALPATCPLDPASGCPRGGISCGGACCVPGEWCDDLIQVCRCGLLLSCGQGDDVICGGSGGEASCGDVCCGSAGLTGPDDGGYAAISCGV